MDETPPALWDYVDRTYQALLERAEQVSIEGEDRIVYEGFISRMISEDLHIPVPNYGKTLGALKQMGCITQLKRGGGAGASKWILWKAPTVDEFMQVNGNIKTKYTTQVDRLEQRIDDVQKAVGGINVPQALTDLAMRVQALEEASK